MSSKMKGTTTYITYNLCLWSFQKDIDYMNATQRKEYVFVSKHAFQANRCVKMSVIRGTEKITPTCSIVPTYKTL